VSSAFATAKTASDSDISLLLLQRTDVPDFSHTYFFESYRSETNLSGGALFKDSFW